MNRTINEIVDDIEDEEGWLIPSQYCEFCGQDMETSDKDKCSGECDHYPLEEDEDMPKPVIFYD